jgi:hypothetical protein
MVRLIYLIVLTHFINNKINGCKIIIFIKLFNNLNKTNILNSIKISRFNFFNK